MEKIDWIKIRKILAKEWLIFLVLVIVIVVGFFVAYFWYNQIDEDRKIVYKKVNSYTLLNVYIYDNMWSDIKTFNGGYISEKEFTYKMIKDSSYAYKFWEFTGSEKEYGSWERFIKAFRLSESKYKEYFQLREKLEAIDEDKELLEDLTIACFYGLLIIVYPLRFTILITRKAIRTIKS